MARPRRRAGGSGAKKAEEVADAYLPPDSPAAAKAEMDRLLHPEGVGHDGAAFLPVSHGELTAASNVVAALALDRDDSPSRLSRIRAYLLTEYEGGTFELAFWKTVAAAAKQGRRNAMQAIFRLLYGWRDSDSIEERLGATVDEAKDALTQKAEVSRLTADELLENFVVFIGWWADRHLRVQREALLERLTKILREGS